MCSERNDSKTTRGRRAVGYIRVSVKNQEALPSIDAQMEANLKWADEAGLTVVGWYIDEGCSGSALERRAAFQAMCDEVQSDGEEPGEATRRRDSEDR